MTIRAFEPYLQQRGFISTSPLSILSDSRLGIDASHYIRKLLSSSSTREVLVAATGGLPIALTTQIESDLRCLERLRIKPVFVFPGLPLTRAPPPKGRDPVSQREAGIKDAAWAAYEVGDVDASTKTFLSVRHTTEYRDVTRVVLRVFRHRMVEYMFAPYLQWAQLSYLATHPKQYVHTIYSSLEMLTFPTTRVILSIDFPPAGNTSSNGIITFLDKPRILKEIALTPDQFLDFAILSGFELCPTFPVIADNFFTMAAIETVRQAKTGLAAIMYHQEHPIVKSTGYIEQYLRIRAAIKYSLVLSADDGSCIPLPLALPPPGAPILVSDIPSDMDHIFSPRFPDELYHHLSKGLISPQLLGWLSSGMIIEPQPLDNGESLEFMRFIKDVITEGLTAPRNTALGLLASVLNPGWLQRKVSANYYFDNHQSPPLASQLPFASKQTKQLMDNCATWHVPCQMVEDELRRQNSSTIDFTLCLGATCTDELAKRTKPAKPSTKPLEKKDEIVANVIWRFLDLRGFQQSSHAHTHVGRALYNAIKSSRLNDKFQEPLYLALELSRAGVLHGDAWSGKSYSGGPGSGTDQEKTSLMLFMRCLSIVPLMYKNQQWAGPLSRELLVFNSFVRSLSRSLRHLFEAVCVHALLRGDAKRQRDDFVDIALSLPFQTEVNTGFGILAKVYIEATIYNFGNGEQVTITASDAGSDKMKEAKEFGMGIVEESFGMVKNPRGEVERGFRFWDSLMVAVKSLAKDQGTNPQTVNVVMQPNVIQQFMECDAWLKPLRP